MGRPKKWYVTEDTGLTPGVFVNCDDGPMKLPDSEEVLGRVLDIVEPKKEKYPTEGFIFKCENGKVFLPLNGHDSTKTASRFKDVKSPTEFITRWKRAVGTTAAASTPIATPPCTKKPLRESNSPTTILPSSKRLKYIEEDIDGRIEKCKKGIMELPIKNITKPPKGSRLLREPDNIFIAELKKKMVKDPSAPGAAPMAVLCKNVQSIDAFEIKHKNVYSYEVLGGLHTLMAKSQLSADDPENPFFKLCLAEVYIGLTDEEALRLSQRHNQTSHFIHSVTHRDLVEACRARLYKMASLDLEVDDTPMPTSAWKESCTRAIIPQDVSKTHRDAIFSQAAMAKPVWTLAIKVMDLFRKAKLKGQKLKLSSLMSEPDFKQQYLVPIRTLPENDQCYLLQRVIDGEISIADLKGEAGSIKQMECLKKVFLKLVNLETWGEAEEKMPQFAATEQLQKFAKVNLKHGIPPSFSEFCSRAKQSLEQLPECSSVVIKGADSNCNLHILQSTFTELCSSKLSAVYHNFAGVSLAVVCFDKEDDGEKIASVSYTIKEINSANSYNLYTVVGICDPIQGQHVEKAWVSAFNCFDILYFADEDEGNDLEEAPCFCRCVKQLVFGFFSATDDGAKQHTAHFTKKMPNFYQGAKRELCKYLIENFSFPEAIILDMTDFQGVLSEIAVLNGRNAVFIAQSDDSAEMIAKLSSSLE